MSRLIPHIGRTSATGSRGRATVVVYLSDHQQPYDGSSPSRHGAMELCAGVDVLIHDSQYTPAEFEMKRDWGHCMIEYALWLAAEAARKRLALFHHDPSARRRPARRARRRARRSPAGSSGSRCCRLRGPAVDIARSPDDRVDASDGRAAAILGVAFVVAGASKLAAGRAGRRRPPGSERRRGRSGAVPWIELGARGDPGRATWSGGRRRSPARVSWSRSPCCSCRRLREGRHPPCACFGAWSAPTARPGHRRAQRRARRPRDRRRSA